MNKPTIGAAHSVGSDGLVRLGRWLAEGRKKAGLNMRELAAVLAVPSHTVIGKIELGQRRVDALELLALCDALGLDPFDAIKVIRG